MKNDLSFFTVTVFLLLCSNAAVAQNAKREPAWNYPPELPGSRTEVYKTIGDVQLKVWIYEPQRFQFYGKRPAIVFFFGGGWKGGTPGQFAKHCQYLSSRGIVAMTADYRVASRHNVKADTCVADCKSAVRWIRQNAERLGVDPKRIAAGGGSAGGHTAVCTGVLKGLEDPADDPSISSVPNALVLFNPAVMLEKYKDDSRWDELAELRYKKEPLATRTGVPPRDISPIHHVRSGLPPTIIFHGEADTTVPFWTVEAYTKAAQDAGNRCELKGYPDQAHGFFNTGRGGSAEKQDAERQMFARTIVQLDTFLNSLGFVEGEPTLSAPAGANVHLRGSLRNSLRTISHQLKSTSPRAVNVAFMGGSITEGNGYRVKVGEWLQQRFPRCRFNLINAGISSTCSTTGAFRLPTDVLNHGPVDLFFVEFAVNDDQDAAHAQRECIRGMEGIIRHVRQSSPQTDIVMTHFVNPPILKLLQEGKTPVSIASHESVARHYDVPTVDLAQEVVDQITSNKITWEQYGGTHPKPFGHQMCADMIADLLSSAWNQPVTDDAKPENHRLPESALDPHCYAAGGFLNSQKLQLADGWTYAIPDWATIPGGKRRRFTDIKVVSCDAPQRELTIPFSGTAIGAYVVAGPDAGIVEASINDGEYRAIDLYHRFSHGLHYPRTVMFATGLSDGSHTLKIRLAKTHHKDSTGTAARILQFVVNSSR